MAADWNAIKTEYITTNTSYRKLAEKYGVHYTNIAKMASSEGWQQLRQQQANTALTKALEAVSSAQATSAVKLQEVADKLLAKIEAMVDEDRLTSTTVRNITGALKDLKEIKMVRSDADIREQEARIDKLRREAMLEDNSNSKTITVTIEGGKESWQS